MSRDTREGEADTSPIDQDERVRHYRWDETTPPSIAVVEAVAAATGRDPTALPSLHRTVDGDALDTVLTNGTDSSVQMTFTYGGVAVTVDQSGAIEVGRPRP